MHFHIFKQTLLVIEQSEYPTLAPVM